MSLAPLLQALVVVSFPIIACSACDGVTMGSGGIGGRAGTGGTGSVDRDGGAAGASGTGGAGGAVCYGGSLAQHCSGLCRSFEEALAEADSREDFQDCSEDGTLDRQYTRVGTCGEFRWVLVPVGDLDYLTEYFDSAGTMVGATHGTDCDCFCDFGSFTEDYGSVPDCERELVDTPCEPDGP